MQLSPEALKTWLQKTDLRRLDKVLLVLSTCSKPMSVPAIRATARTAGCNMQKWNLSDVIAKGKDLTLRLTDGYEISEGGKARLSELGLSQRSASAIIVANDLRSHLKKINDSDTKSFIEEAILCYGHNLFRSAIVMSWMAAVDVLKKEVVLNHLAAFNAESKRINPKWKDASNADEIGLMGEGDFLNRLMQISVVGKNRKQRLEQALTLRNGCGHPNSLKVGQNETAAHIEALLKNVFEIFNP